MHGPRRLRSAYLRSRTEYRHRASGFEDVPAHSISMKILFLHGWHSLVGGVKPTYLRDQGNEVINPKLDDDDFGAALLAAQEAYNLHQPDVVVGSSRGGAVAMNIDSKNTPLVLLCPAWRNWGRVRRLKVNTIVLHSRHDDVISFEDSEELIAVSGLPQDALIEVGEDHRLADEQSLTVMLWACRGLVSKELAWTADELQLSSIKSRAATGNCQSDASYICDACGEEIVIPLDVSEGEHQTYVEDCPVCCRASVIHVHIDEHGIAQAWAEPEQDHD
jgi:hypothetical protein